MFVLIKKNGFKCAFYKLFSRIFPKDEAIVSACDRIGAYRYLQKYNYVLDNFHRTYRPVEADERMEMSFKQRIWLFWFQGFDNAPLLVQKCRDSVLKFHSNCEVVILDQNNLADYIDIPDYIVEKHERGIIHHTQFSDYVRIALLAKHGGIWIDSTTLLTDNLPDYILNADLFSYKVLPLGKVSASSWFVAAKPGNPIILQILALFNEYWEKEKKLISYSLIHLCWTMVVSYNDINRRIWEEVPYFDDINCKLLQLGLFTTYSEKRYQQITNMSSVHKLTYKFSKGDSEKEDTFYTHLFC